MKLNLWIDGTSRKFGGFQIGSTRYMAVANSVLDARHVAAGEGGSVTLGGDYQAWRSDYGSWETDYLELGWALFRPIADTSSIVDVDGVALSGANAPLFLAFGAGSATFSGLGRLQTVNLSWRVDFDPIRDEDRRLLGFRRYYTGSMPVLGFGPGDPNASPTATISPVGPMPDDQESGWNGWPSPQYPGHNPSETVGRLEIIRIDHNRHKLLWLFNYDRDDSADYPSPCAELPRVMNRLYAAHVEMNQVMPQGTHAYQLSINPVNLLVLGPDFVSTFQT